jgi:hypothetical protein
MKLFLNLQKYVVCISLGKRCFHHIHVPYAPDMYSSVTEILDWLYICNWTYQTLQLANTIYFNFLANFHAMQFSKAFI